MTDFPPGPGNPRQTFMKFQADPLGYLRELAQTYGDLVHYRLITADVYLVNHPDLIREVLIEKADKFDRTDHTKETLGRFLGEGLLVSAGAYHKRQRAVIQPMFTADRIAGYSPAIVSCTAKMLDGWRHGDVRDIAEEMMALTLTIIAETVFGADLSAATAEIGKAMTIFQKDAGEKMRRHGHPVADEEYQAALHTVDTILKDLIAERREHRSTDLLSLLASATNPETGLPLSEPQIRDEAMTLLMAGHETTANVLAWTLMLLDQHPNILARLLDELDSELQGHLPTLGDLFHLPYLDMVLKESMRLYPPSWIIGRRPLEPITVGGYTVNPDATVVISIWAMHRDPRFFAEPEQFKPQRFLEEHVRYSYIPFGGGPHVCIGQSFAAMESALILATVLQRFHIEVLPDQTLTPEPLITLRPANGIQARLVERSRQLAANDLENAAS